MTITYQSSVVFVQDIAASRRFYEELLGQEVEMDHGPSLTFKSGFALWQVDHAFQIIHERLPDDVARLGGQYHELHFETADAKVTSLCTLCAKCPGASVSFASAILMGTLSPWESLWPRSSHVCSVRVCQ